MYDYLVSATDENGTRTTRYVSAASACAAVAQLKAEGCTDIVLHTEDVGAAIDSMTSSTSDEVSPEELVSLRFLSPFGYFLFLLKKSYRAAVWSLVLAVPCVAWLIYLGRGRGLLFWGAIMVIVAPFLSALHFAFFSKTRRFYQLMDASAWGRWEAVLELVPRLRAQTSDFELDVREAIALAKTGFVQEGLRKMERHADSPKIPSWIYLVRLAEFHDSLDNYDLALDCLRQAHEDAPDNPTVALDYALGLLKYDTDTPKARRLIEWAQRQPLSDVLQMILPLIQGILAVNEGNYDQAIASLEKSRATVQPLVAAEPLFGPILDYCRAYLAIAYARTGDLEMATRYYRVAKRRLQALGANWLLARLHREIGVPV